MIDSAHAARASPTPVLSHRYGYPHSRVRRHAGIGRSRLSKTLRRLPRSKYRPHPAPPDPPANAGRAHHASSRLRRHDDRRLPHEPRGSPGRRRLPRHQRPRHRLSCLRILHRPDRYRFKQPQSRLERLEPLLFERPLPIRRSRRTQRRWRAETETEMGLRLRRRCHRLRPAHRHR